MRTRDELTVRETVRAVILDPDERILLCRMARPGPPPYVEWHTPGGGIERGETPLAALARELCEEVGLTLPADPRFLWQDVVVAASGWGALIHDFYLIRTAAFDARGTLSGEELLAEGIDGFGWWSLPEIAGHAGSDRFVDRDLVGRLTALLAAGTS